MALCLAVAGCGAPATSGVANTARGFYGALLHDNGRRACRLLAPETRHELVQTAKVPCSTAILREDIPDPGRLLAVEHFGEQAQVRGRGDTTFLAQFPDGWKVIAAGCTPRRPLPYDCEVKS